MTIITSNPPCVELTIREFNCVKSILARKPKVRDGLDERIDERMAALEKTLGKLELNGSHGLRPNSTANTIISNVHNVRFGPATDAIIRDVQRLLGIYDSMCVPDTNVYTRAYAGQAAAWNELFDPET